MAVKERERERKRREFCEKRRYILARSARADSFCADQRAWILQETDESKRIDDDPFCKIANRKLATPVLLNSLISQLFAEFGLIKARHNSNF